MPRRDGGASPRHGFVLPAYGDSPGLSACLASLAAQTAGSPVIVTTSTPSDAIAQAADAAGAQLRVNPTRAGIGQDWNFALSQAPWPRVTIAHQDDLFEPTFAERSVGALDLTGAALAFTAHDEVDDRGVGVSNKTIRVKHAIEALATLGATSLGPLRRRLLLSFGNPIGCAGVTFDLDRLGPFRFDEDMASNLDWAAWWRLHQAGVRFAYVREVLLHRRYTAESATAGLLQSGSRAVEDRLMFERIWPRPVSRVLGSLYKLGYR